MADMCKQQPAVRKRRVATLERDAVLGITLRFPKRPKSSLCGVGAKCGASEYGPGVEAGDRMAWPSCGFSEGSGDASCAVTVFRIRIANSCGRRKKDAAMPMGALGGSMVDAEGRSLMGAAGQGDVSVFAVPAHSGGFASPSHLQHHLQHHEEDDDSGTPLSPAEMAEVVMEEEKPERVAPKPPPTKRTTPNRPTAAATRKAKAQAASAAARAARLARAAQAQEEQSRKLVQEVTIVEDLNDGPKMREVFMCLGGNSFFSPSGSSPLTVFGKGPSAAGPGSTAKAGDSGLSADSASASSVPVVVLDEETRMSAEISAMDTDSNAARDGLEGDAKAQPLPPPPAASASGTGDTSATPTAGGGVPPTGEESQGSAMSSETVNSAAGGATPGSGARRNKCRMEVVDPDAKEFSVDMLAEYQWPAGRTGESLMLQEQVAEYLGVKSFKRKYPDIQRRAVEAEEKSYLREKGLVSDNLSDLGLTAVSSVEVLDIMFADFPEKYEEYRKHLRERQAKEMSMKQKLTSTTERSRVDSRERASSSAASWNAKFNRARRDQRRACFDLQNLTVHFPASRIKKMTREVPKLGNYPIALIPGQFTDYYKIYTPAELRYFPLNTVLYGPMKPNERQEPGGGSDGSQSDSDDSSSSDESSSSSSSDGSQDSADTGSTAEEAETTEAAVAPDASKGTPTVNGAGSAPVNGGRPAPKTKEEAATVKEDAAICKVCGGDRGRNKEGSAEVLIECATCTSSCHPSCIDLTLDMVPHIKKYNWQCTDCKICIQCKDPADEDKMLFCDMCDRGYHIYCVGLRRVPSGRWHCRECAICGSCGAREPGPGPDAAWQHEYKKADGKGSAASSPVANNQRVYAQTLCVACSKLWRRGRYCQLCWRCFDAKTDDDASLITCSVCDKMMHPDCCSAVGRVELDKANFLCEICQEKGHQARPSTLKLSMRPVVKV